MQISKQLLLATLISITLVACGGTQQTDNIEESKRVEGENISNNPLGIIQQATQAGKKIQNLQETIAKQEPVDPIHFQELISLLPEPLAGWEAAAAEGETNSFGGFSISQASRSYSSGDRTIDISITDWAYNTGLYASFMVGADFSQESTQGYNKGIKLGDTPGREEYDFNSKDGTLSLLAEQRFFVEIDGRQVEPEDLQKWWNTLDKEAMSKLNQQSQK